MKKIITTAIMCVAATAAFADSHADNREQRQEQRIQQGVQSGALTAKEAEQLNRGQAHVDKMQDRAMADGKVTAKEGSRINHAQDVQNQRIYQQKHDRQHDFNHDGVKDKPRHHQGNGRGEKHHGGGHRK